MREADFDEFGALLDAVCGLLSRGSYVPNATNTALWFRAMEAYDLATVRAALDAHVRDPQRGRFVPTPADVIAQIEGFAEHDGRPGVEEAWALALRARDEAETVVWTREMAEAWSVAKPVLQLGDEVGARMAFREAYGRLVDEARRQRVPASWSASLGHDPALRVERLRAAVDAGRLPQAELLALDATRADVLALGYEPASGSASDAEIRARAALRALGERLKAKQDEPSRDALARASTEEAKDRTAEQVAQYAAERGIPLEPSAPQGEEGEAS